MLHAFPATRKKMSEEDMWTRTFLTAYLGSSGKTRRIFPSQNSATTRSFFHPYKDNSEGAAVTTKP